MPRNLTVEQRNVDQVLVIALVGELMVGTATQLREQMQKILEGGARKIVLNLAGLSYLDSTGVGVLLAMKTSAVHHNAQMKLCCLQPIISRLLRQLRLTSILDIHEEEISALSAFAR